MSDEPSHTVPTPEPRVPPAGWREKIRRRFAYHAPNPRTEQLHNLVNQACQAMAESIATTTEFSREQSLTMTALEEVRFRWNQAVAMDGQGFDPADR